MPKKISSKGPNRAVFISHASADRALVNYFVDVLLTGGVGVGHQHIFNTSAKTSPLEVGGNFTPEIREALVGAKVVFALVTPMYLTRPFTMAELGAAWALKNLFPIIVPPITFNDLEGVLDGVQSVRINDEEALHRIYDQFDRDHLNEGRWFERAGSHTWVSKLKEFTAGLPAQLKGLSTVPKLLGAVTPTSTKLPTSSSGPTQTSNKPGRGAGQQLSREQEPLEFKKLLAFVRDAISDLPWSVRRSFVHELNGEWGKCEGQDQEWIDVEHAERMGLLEIIYEDEEDPIHRTALFRPSKKSQRVRTVHAHLQELAGFLKLASEGFHSEYESANGHPADTGVLAFWDTEDLYGNKLADKKIEQAGQKK